MASISACLLHVRESCAAGLDDDVVRKEDEKMAVRELIIGLEAQQKKVGVGQTKDWSQVLECRRSPVSMYVTRPLHCLDHLVQLVVSAAKYSRLQY